MSSLRDVLQDTHHAVSTWWRYPLFNLTTVATIGLGIGAATTAFSLLDSLFLRRLPVPAGDRLMRVHFSRPGRSGALGLSAIHALRDRATAFDAVIAHDSRNVLLVRIGNRSIEQHGAFVSANYWSTLGITPRLGRFFLPAEDSVVDRDPVVVVSSAFWHAQLADDPHVIGRHIQITDRDVVIIGVAPEGFQGIAVGEMPNDVWLPMMMGHLGRMQCISEPRCREGEALARLAPRATRLDAEVQTRSLEATLSRIAFGDDSIRRVVAAPAQGLSIGERGQFVALIQLLSGIATLILLIACANLSSLLVARGVTRHREMAVRVSLGATRGRLARQLLTENLLIALVGGAVGLLLSVWATQGLMGLFLVDEEGFHHFFDLTLNAHVLVFTLATSMATVVLFGLLPAFTASRADPATALKSGSIGAARGRTRSILVGVQVALSVVLLTGAMLLARSWASLMSAQASGRAVVLFRWRPDLAGYPTQRSMAELQQVVDQLRVLPNVESVGFRRCCGLLWSSAPTRETPIGLAATDTIALVQEQFVSPAFFATLNVPLIAGREFLDAEREGTPRAVVINQALAARLVGTTAPPAVLVGRDIRVDSMRARVVGIVPDFQTRTAFAPIPLVAYEPYWQTTAGSDGDTRFAIRVRGDPAVALPSLVRAVSSVDPRVLVTEAMPMSAQIDANFVQLRLGEWVLLSSAAAALLLTGMGLYGVIAFLAARRVREVGIRIALGASGNHVVFSFLRHGMWAAMLGIAVGSAAAFSGARVLSAWLIGIEPNDSLSYCIAITLAIGISALASYIPARRASRVDPVVALRAE